MTTNCVASKILARIYVLFSAYVKDLQLECMLTTELTYPIRHG